MMQRVFILLVCLLFSTMPARAEEVLIFAAASLKGPLDAVLADQQGVTVSYAGSGTLARQIIAGAPADLAIMAHPQWSDVLDAEGRNSENVPLLTNELVLIAPIGASSLPLTTEALKAALGPEGRLAIGFVKAVPAGIYGQEALISLSLWDAISDRLAEVDNVRAVLALVARGEVPLGITYATDAAISDDVVIVARFPPDSHAPIVYTLQTIGPPTDATQTVHTLLTSPDAREIFAAAGFGLP